MYPLINLSVAIQFPHGPREEGAEGIMRQQQDFKAKRWGGQRSRDWRTTACHLSPGPHRALVPCFPLMTVPSPVPWEESGVGRRRLPSMTSWTPFPQREAPFWSGAALPHVRISPGLVLSCPPCSTSRKQPSTSSSPRRSVRLCLLCSQLPPWILSH